MTCTVMDVGTNGGVAGRYTAGNSQALVGQCLIIRAHNHASMLRHT